MQKEKKPPATILIFAIRMARKLVTINGITWVAQPWMELTLKLYPDGTVKHGLLDKPTEIDGYPLCYEAAFYPSGKLKCGRLHRNVERKGVIFSGHIYLYENGELRSSKLTATSDICGISFRSGQYVDFDEKGNVIAGCLGKNTELGNMLLPAGTFVKAGEQGLLQAVRSDGKTLKEGNQEQGIEVNDLEVTSWAKDGRDVSWGSCSFRDFLHGNMNDAVKSGLPLIFDRVYALAKEKHAHISDIIPEVRISF
jgi:hypothetical protein